MFRFGSPLVADTGAELNGIVIEGIEYTGGVGVGIGAGVGAGVGIGAGGGVCMIGSGAGVGAGVGVGSYFLLISIVLFSTLVAPSVRR